MPSEPNAQAASMRAAEYEFGPFRLDAARRTLYRGAEFVPLSPDAVQLLVLLVEEAGRIVSRERILERAWAGAAVEEGTIESNVSALRKALDPAFGGEGPIASVARQGYRFTAAVRPAGAASQTAPDPAPRRITDRDTILLGDIENKTGDPVFDGTLKQALLLALAQSPFLDLLSDRKVRSALQMMQRPVDTPAVGDVALEICQRTGAKAAITGAIFALGDEYMIGLTALDADTGSVLVAEQARAHGKGEVLRALDAAAQGMRTKLGESLASVRRFSAPFDEVVTTSLEALKAYTLGRREWHDRGDAAVIPHQLRAIELDPNFASAYSGLAIAYANLGQTIRATEFMQKAYDLRERATERERFRIITSYHAIITGNLHRALDAANAWVVSYPRDLVGPGNAGGYCMLLGLWEKALELTEGAEQNSNITMSNLAIILMALGRHEDARRTLDAAFGRGMDAYFLRLDAYQEAFLRGDDEAMRRHFDAVAGRQGEEDFLLGAQADTEAFFGRMDRSREFTARAAECALRAGSPETSATWLAQAAVREVEMGFAERALDIADTALTRSEGRHVRAIATYALARAGDRTTVDAMVAELDRDYAEDSVIQRYWLPCIRAAIALGSGDWRSAVRALEPAQAMELALTGPFESAFALPPYLRGLAYIAAKRNDEASRELAKIEARPGLVKNFVTYPLAVKARASIR
ncbi:MAG TPA: winged helix-turn-helix domain-containing protein [Usitatibacter sp.]|nr:winged helix-turn-helix domain-containing protein [Usitatibacter sp.]